MDLLNVREKLLSDFLEEIGIKKPTEKRERLVVDEVNSNDSMLYLNIKEMFDCRKEACNDINKIFNLDISVECLVDNDSISDINVSKNNDEVINNGN